MAKRDAAAAADKGQDQAQDKPAAPARVKDYAEVTYIPINSGDPHTVTWHGIVFRAHVAERVPLNRTYLCPQRVEHNLPDGTITTKHVEKPISLVELARNNPSFLVDGKRAEQKQGQARTPEDAKEYRNYCVRWIAAADDVKSMDIRWDAEEPLRTRCNIEDADLAYLRPFFEARKEIVAENAKKPKDNKRHGTNALEYA